MIKTSVIITVYNRSHLLRKALLSLKNQSVKPDELVLSDDGSEEDVVSDIIDIVKGFDFPVKYVKQINKGFRLAKCRNNGVRNSKGDLLIFMDQDIVQTKNLFKSFIDNRKEKRFLTSGRVFLSEEQSNQITEQKIIDGNFYSVIEQLQKEDVAKLYKKDRIYYLLHKFNLKDKPSLRGYYHAINRADYIAVNGYDEKYIGWGAEDDDICRRLYKFGVEGFNPTLDEYPIHLFHERATAPNTTLKDQANYNYHIEKLKDIKAGNYRTEYGFDNPFDEDTFTVTELN